MGWPQGISCLYYSTIPSKRHGSRPSPPGPTTLSVCLATLLLTHSLDHTLAPLSFCPVAHPVLHPSLFALQLVMEDIFISGDPLLESVGLHEPLVEELRAVIANALRKAMIPLQAYAKEYRRYLELNNSDVATFLKYVCV